MRVGLVLALSIWSLPALAESPQAIGERLDMTSFPNSVGPRLEDASRTLADYGFTKIVVDGETVRFIEPDDSWLFAIRVLDTPPGQIVLCIEDKAQNGGTYHIVQGLEVSEGVDGLLHATGDRATHPDCAERE